jgi:hypothetical protein
VQGYILIGKLFEWKQQQTTDYCAKKPDKHSAPNPKIKIETLTVRRKIHKRNFGLEFFWSDIVNPYNEDQHRYKKIDGDEWEYLSIVSIP